MIDLHSHILAGIDDGASSLDDSLALIQGSVDGGVVKILATPHIHLATFDNDVNTIQQAFDKLTQYLASKQFTSTNTSLTNITSTSITSTNTASTQIPYVNAHPIQISLAYAAEVRICPEIMMLAKANTLPFMGKWEGDNLLLLEFPHSHIPPGSEKLIDWLNKHHIRTMIAHPERNRDVWQCPEILSPFRERGCLFQVTAASLLGDFGPRSKAVAWEMIEHNQVTVVASDMHNVKRRPSKMKDAFLAIDAEYGVKLAEQLLIETPNLIFESNPTIWVNQ